MGTLIVYYSQGGNTEYVAEKVADKTGADILRIEPEKAYPGQGFRKFFWGGKSSVMAEKPKLSPYEYDPGKYDKIIFGFPVWAGNVTPPIRTFIKDNDLSGIKCSAFACQSGAGAEKALRRLEECLNKKLDSTLILNDPKDKPNEDNEKKIDEFCRALKK